MRAKSTVPIAGQTLTQGRYVGLWLGALGLMLPVTSVQAQSQSQTVEQRQQALGGRIQKQEGIATESDPRALKRLDTRLKTRLQTRIDRFYGTQTDVSTSYTPKIDTTTVKPK